MDRGSGTKQTVSRNGPSSSVGNIPGESPVAFRMLGTYFEVEMLSDWMAADAHGWQRQGAAEVPSRFGCSKGCRQRQGPFLACVPDIPLYLRRCYEAEQQGSSAYSGIPERSAVGPAQPIIGTILGSGQVCA